MLDRALTSSHSHSLREDKNFLCDTVDKTLSFNKQLGGRSTRIWQKELGRDLYGIFPIRIPATRKVTCILQVPQCIKSLRYLTSCSKTDLLFLHILGFQDVTS
jgi:hypothetical protein